MKTWSFFDKRTGSFVGRRYMCDHAAFLTENTPIDCAPIEGVFDELAQRVDIESGAVVGYQPPAPSADHEWNAETKRWQIKASIAEQQVSQTLARARIEALEGRQARVLRELALSHPSALDQLNAIETEIVSLRRSLAR